jgi:hypothetical protein
MEGCPSCAEYLPRLKRIMRGPLKVIDVNSSPEASAFADRYKINSIPMTFIYREKGVKRLTGSVSNRVLRQTYWSET